MIPVLKLEEGTGTPFFMTTTSSEAQQFSPCAITPPTDPIFVTTRPAKPFPTFSTVGLKAINPETSPSAQPKRPPAPLPDDVFENIFPAEKPLSTLPPSHSIPAKPPALLLLPPEFLAITSAVEKLLTIILVFPPAAFPTFPAIPPTASVPLTLPVEKQFSTRPVWKASVDPRRPRYPPKAPPPFVDSISTLTSPRFLQDPNKTPNRLA